MINNIDEQNILLRFNLALKQYPFIHIYGKGGMGKTTLVLYLLSRLLKNDETCLWVQASNLFPKRRLSQMVADFPERLNHLQSHFLILPNTGIIKDFKEQEYLLRKVSHAYLEKIPGLSYLIIDTISHHLRYHLSLEKEMNARARIVNDFFEQHLFPLLMKCSLNKVSLFLIHEVSSGREKGTKMFYDTLFSRIKGITIELYSDFFNHHKYMKIKMNGRITNFEYKINSEGFIFSSL